MILACLLAVALILGITVGSLCKASAKADNDRADLHRDTIKRIGQQWIDAEIANIEAANYGPDETPAFDLEADVRNVHRIAQSILDDWPET